MTRYVKLVLYNSSPFIKATPSVMKKKGLIRDVTSLEWGSLIVFYYLVASGIGPDQRSGLW